MLNASQNVSSAPRIFIGVTLAFTAIATCLLVSAFIYPEGSFGRHTSLTASGLKERPSQPAAVVRGTIPPSERSCSNSVCVYHNSEQHISLQYPESWGVREGLFGTIVSFISPLNGKNDQFSENINVVTENVGSDMTLDDYYKASEANLKKYFTQFKVIKIDSASLGGSPARIVTYNATQGTVKLHTTQIFSLNSGKAYIVTLSNIQSSPTTFFSDMAKIAGSFTFTP